MALPKMLLQLVSLGLALGMAQGHQSPRGEAYPNIEVIDGKFAITFTAKDETPVGQLHWQKNAYFRIIYSPDGKVVVPRHRVEPEPEFSQVECRSNIAGLVVQTRPTGEGQRFVLTKIRIEGIPLQETPLPITPEKYADISACTFSEKWLGFTWTDYNENPADQETPISLYLTHVARDGTQPGSRIRLGKPARIYWFPCASPPVWAGGRWWVAWVKAADTPTELQNPTTAWQTVLSSYDPTSGKLTEERLPGQSHWNAHLDLKTTKGWLCATWHASRDGDYPGVGRIITAFKAVPAP